MGETEIVSQEEFQFTHPGRGATVSGKDFSHLRRVSIHAPREGCDYFTWDGFVYCNVSIHAPREGCDTALLLIVKTNTKFQFTHPGRGATL